MPVDTLSLEGKIAIVTGSGRENGIGAGIALALARNGASVTINYVSDSTAERASKVADVLRAAGGKAILVQSPVDTLEGAQNLVKKTLQGFETNHIDILVNNAVTVFPSSITGEIRPSEVEKVYQVNTHGPMYMVNSVLPHMPYGGRIVNISSIDAKLGSNFVSTYTASKAALDAMTLSWAAELGKSHGITVNSVAPGPVITDLVPPELVDVIVTPRVEKTKAAARPGTPADVGDAVLLLVSEKARWITGQIISVSGGL
ncbi:hypothetical protein NQ176_g3781 [Zarea fungicola]|uniref:Uncharacterized protein n=1 Tax=Zarea fungicola TaxID=93591 RepID=A0ACC1NJ02_9HYPO|nr:hypothetical protein NQ176_g3781 [Lecanicillium fungicola]